MREQRVQTVSELVNSRFDWAQAFHELGRVLPPGKVSLASLTGTVGSGSSAGAVQLERDRGERLLGHLRDSARQHPHVRAHRLRDQPGRGRADARPPAPDRRRQRSDAAELDQVRLGRWWQAAARAVKAAMPPSACRSPSTRCRASPRPAARARRLSPACHSRPLRLPRSTTPASTSAAGAVR